VPHSKHAPGDAPCIDIAPVSALQGAAASSTTATVALLVSRAVKLAPFFVGRSVLGRLSSAGALAGATATREQRPLLQRLWQ
jgi:hypothetical protein